MKTYNILRSQFIIIFFIGVLCLGGCAKFTSNYEEPTVGLKTFRLLPSDGIVPTFEIGLHIINPNRDPLNIDGLYYTVNIEGHKVLAGVASDLPEIKGYGEGDITIQATVDLLSGAKLIRSLLMQPTSSLEYTFNAKLDMGPFTPTMNIVEKGQISTDNL
ncbi:LEA/WHy family protein [Desulforhopalus sp. 52FAK]